jgi:hypothetical protein
MKTKLYFLMLMTLPFLSYATPRTINKAQTNNANWSSTGAWSQGRIPANNDSIIIPAGITITFDVNATLTNVYLTISGTLDFDQNQSMSLDASSVVYIPTGGTLTATHPTPNELISIGGVNKYNGKTDNTISGPAIAASYTSNSPSGFSSAATLPVTFSFFGAERNGNGAIQLSWTTQNETNNNHFELQRSANGSDWTEISVIAAGGNATGDSYSYTDESAGSSQAYYRVRQVDIDGRYMYSKIAVIGAEGSVQATIFASGKTVNVVAATVGGSRIVVRLVSLAGQVLQQQSFESASGRIEMEASSARPGIYIVQVTDGSSWSVVKKVML